MQRRPGAHVTILDCEGGDTQAQISTDTSVTPSDTRFALALDPETVLADGDEYTFRFEMLDPEGRPVTVTHNAIWASE